MKLLICSSCKQYTMKKNCPKCGGTTNAAKPPKYSVEDKYGHLRRKAKAQEN